MKDHFEIETRPEAGCGSEPARGKAVFERRAGEDAAEIHVIFCNGGSAVSLAGLMEPLRFANQALGRDAYRWSVAGYPHREARLSFGPCVSFEDRWDMPERPQNVVLIGGPDLAASPLSSIYAPLVSQLNHWRRHGTRVISIDLVMPGILPGTLGRFSDAPQVSVHWKRSHTIKELNPDATVVETLFTVSGGMVFCAGECSVTDLVLEDISRGHGARVASEVSDCMLRGHARIGNARQRRARSKTLGTDGGALAQILELMESNIEEPLTIEELCRVARIGPRRKLERMFRRAFDTTPLAYYMELRLEKAKSLLEWSELSVSEISGICGFASRAYFAKRFRQAFGMLPAEFRRQSV